MHLHAVTLDERLGRDAAGKCINVADQWTFRTHLDAHWADACIDRCAGRDGRQNVDDVDFDCVRRTVAHRDGTECEHARTLALAGHQPRQAFIDLAGADDTEAHLRAAGLREHATARPVKCADGDEHG